MSSNSKSKYIYYSDFLYELGDVNTYLHYEVGDVYSQICL